MMRGSFDEHQQDCFCKGGIVNTTSSACFSAPLQFCRRAFAIASEMCACLAELGRRHRKHKSPYASPPSHGIFGLAIAEEQMPQEKVAAPDHFEFGFGPQPRDDQLAALAMAVLERSKCQQSAAFLCYRADDGNFIAEVASNGSSPCCVPAELAVCARFLHKYGPDAAGCQNTVLVIARDFGCFIPPSQFVSQALYDMFVGDLRVIFGHNIPGRKGIGVKVLTVADLHPFPAQIPKTFCLPPGAGTTWQLPAETSSRGLYDAVLSAIRNSSGSAGENRDRDEVADRGCTLGANDIKSTNLYAAGILDLLQGNGAETTTCRVVTSTPDVGCGRFCQAAADPILRLAPWTCRKPILLIVCDEYGVLRTPSGTARDCLATFGLGELRCLVHDWRTRALHDLRCSELWLAHGEVAVDT